MPQFAVIQSSLLPLGFRPLPFCRLAVTGRDLDDRTGGVVEMATATS
jgi:hypothetical protein